MLFKLFFNIFQNEKWAHVHMDLFLCNYQDHLPTGFHKLDLSGDITIPLNKGTYSYCWQHVYIGVLLDYPEPTGQENDEANEDNNDEWFQIIYDCKGEM